MTRVTIVGGGPGGYEAALVAVQLGAEVTLVEQVGLGGSAVITDCVPSKTLIATAELMTLAAESGALGVRLGDAGAGEAGADTAKSVGVDLAVVNARVRALAHARAQGSSEAVFANLQGQLCEGTGTNVFYVVDGELRTPTLAAGCLAGITRHLVLEWYGGREVDEPIEVLRVASEAFLASTTRDVQAIARWDDLHLAPPGPITGLVPTVWQGREPDLLGR